SLSDLPFQLPSSAEEDTSASETKSKVELFEADDPSMPGYLRVIQGPEKHWSPAYDVTSKRFITAKRENLPGNSWKKAQESQLSRPPNYGQPLSFKDEFYSLPGGRRDFSRNNPVFDDPFCKSYVWNRFPHIPFSEETRVVLSRDASSSNSYINANYITGYKCPPDPDTGSSADCPRNDIVYIGAASPFNSETALDFWRMIEQQEVETVVTLTNVVEDGIIKCAQFWPCCGQRVHTLGYLLLQTVEERTYVHYTIRKIKYRSFDCLECREITQFQFTSWPRQGSPESPVPWLELRRKVRTHHANKLSPLLVHCGTGISRTAAFIALDIAVDQYETEGGTSVYDIVGRMRTERPMMVRNLDQYKFIYACLQEDFEAGLTTLNLLDGLHREREFLSKTNPLTGRTWLYDQFDLLNYFTGDILANDLAVMRQLDGRPVTPYGKYPQ
ncbi:hypothetical protein EGW08_011482, partial [Elysia chlorotica]